jgi:levanbiose-producing levanase
VFPYLIDTGLALFSIDGTAVFENVVIREFSV